MLLAPVLLLLVALSTSATACSCSNDEYCNNNNECLTIGACGTDSDCQLPSNSFSVPFSCEGYSFCNSENRCGWRCGSSCSEDSHCYRESKFSSFLDHIPSTCGDNGYCQEQLKIDRSGGECLVASDCTDDSTYCASNGQCKESGTCMDSYDCYNPQNRQWGLDRCIGIVNCVSGRCLKTCDPFQGKQPGHNNNGGLFQGGVSK